MSELTSGCHSCPGNVYVSPAGWVDCATPRTVLGTPVEVTEFRASVNNRISKAILVGPVCLLLVPLRYFKQTITIPKSNLEQPFFNQTFLNFTPLQASIIYIALNN